MENLLNKKQEKSIILIPYFKENINERREEEIKNLTLSADALVDNIFRQLIRDINPSTIFGSGKLKEINEYVIENQIDTVIVDFELSPSQVLNISKGLSDLKVIDRTTLILDIFALNAKTNEGKLQVELAQLKYLYPRLKGKGAELSRLGGGIGSRGPGETQLETDRRHIRARINTLEAKLKELSKRRKLNKSKRIKNGLKTVSIVGYTNTGKSTLLNTLTNANVLSQNKLFATLDPTSRLLDLGNTQIIIIDTVGFIDNLPTELIEAFKSTLEVAVDSDLILNVCDINDDWEKQLEVTNRTLSELNYSKHILTVFNKCESVSDFEIYPKDAVFISAKENKGIETLKIRMEELLNERVENYVFTVSYNDVGKILSLLKYTKSNKITYNENNVEVEITVKNSNLTKFNEFIDVKVQEDV